MRSKIVHAPAPKNLNQRILAYSFMHDSPEKIALIWIKFLANAINSDLHE